MQVITHFYQFREWIWTQRWAPLHDQEGFEHDSCSLHVHRKKAPEHQQQVYSLLEGRRCPKRVPKKVPQFFFIGKELSRSSQDEHVIKVKCTRIKKSSSFISLFWPSWSPCTACTYQDQLQFFSWNIFGFFLNFEGNFRFWYRKLMIGANVSDDQKNPIRPSRVPCTNIIKQHQKSLLQPQEILDLACQLSSIS